MSADFRARGSGRAGRGERSAGPTSREPVEPSPARVFFTLQQIAERHPAFSMRTLRHWIYNAKDRKAWRSGKPMALAGNGFDRVMVKKGRRIYIDEVALMKWLENGEG